MKVIPIKKYIEKSIEHCNGFECIQLETHGGEDGILIALEHNTCVVPFDIKRVYYIYNVEEKLRRGFHAHKKVKQLIVAVAGSCVLILDDGSNRTSIKMDSPDTGVLITRPLWREMIDFTSDCVLMVAASEVYNADDYIRDYREYRKYVRK